MQDLAHAILEYIDDRLGTMQTHPGSWGSAESLELQALLLLELRTFILRRSVYEHNPFEARNLYIKFIRDHFPGSPSSFMVDAAGDRADLMLPDLIGQLSRLFAERLPAENIFETSNVALELQFPKNYREPHFSAVCDYVTRLQKSLATGITSRVAYRGHKLTFAMPNINVTPANGEGPKVSMSLDAPSSLQQGLGNDLIPEDAFVDALKSVLTAVDTVASGADTKRIGQTTLKRASAMIPGGDIQSIVIGGKSIREKTIVLANYAHLFAELFDKDNTKEEPFDHFGKVDVLDFTQGWFHFITNTTPTRSCKCWAVLAPQFMDRAKQAAPYGLLRVFGTARVPDMPKSGRRPTVNVEVSDVRLIAASTQSHGEA